MDTHTAKLAIVALSIIPSLLLLAAWVRPWMSSEGARTISFLLVISTASYLWQVAAIWHFPVLLGPDYSNRRFAIIDLNCIGMLLCSIAAFRIRNVSRVPLGVACLLTTLLWGILGAINSVV